MVNVLMNKKYKISANFIGYPNGIPKSINEEIPDIRAKKDESDKKEIIIEAETKDSLKIESVRRRWNIFSSEENIDFYVITPEDCIDKAKKIAKELKIDVEGYYTMKI